MTGYLSVIARERSDRSNLGAVAVVEIASLRDCFASRLLRFARNDGIPQRHCEERVRERRSNLAVAVAEEIASRACRQAGLRSQ